MKNTYDKSELTLKKHVVLIEIFDIVPTPKSGLILPNQKKDAQDGVYLESFPDHPFQGRVELVGKDTEDFFPNGLKKNDIVYLDKPPMNTDFVNINGEIYAKINIHSIIMIRKPKKVKNDININ